MAADTPLASNPRSLYQKRIIGMLKEHSTAIGQLLVGHKRGIVTDQELTERLIADQILFVDKLGKFVKDDSNMYLTVLSADAPDVGG